MGAKPGRKKGSLASGGKNGKQKPYKFDNRKRDQWLEQYRKLGSKTAACQSVGIARQTIYDTVGSPDAADKKFAERMEDIEHIQNDMVTNNLFTLTKISTGACVFWLCNRDPEKWKNVQRTEIVGGDKNRPIILEYVPAKRRAEKN